MKSGLVLEGGALRAIFSSGVCDAMLEANMMTDYVVGASAGIAYGVSYVSRQPRRNLKIVTTYASDHRYMGVNNLAKRDNGSYFGLKFVFDTIPNELIPFDYDTFEAFPGTVEAVVTNLNTGRAEYIPVPRRDTKSVVLQASCAMPLMFPIFDLDGTPYMDGGITDGIPWQRALEQGCNRVLVVLSHPRDYVRKPDKMMAVIRRKYKEYPAFLKAIENRAKRYNRNREWLFELEKQGRVKVIAPVSTFGVSRTERDPEKLRALWVSGYEMAMERMDELRDFFRK